MSKRKRCDNPDCRKMTAEWMQVGPMTICYDCARKGNEEAKDNPRRVNGVEKASEK